MFNHIFWYILSYPILSYLILSLSVSYLILSYLILSYLIICYIILGVSLFNYGTRKSYRVHADTINPWAWLLVGAIVLGLGGIMPPSVARYTSDLGITLTLTVTLSL